MTNRPDSTATGGSPDAVKATESDRSAGGEGLTDKQQMVEKLFRHTNQFLEENKRDPLLVVEALAAILARYAALLGPVEQIDDRLSVLERLIGQECAQIKDIAKSNSYEKKR